MKFPQFPNHPILYISGSSLFFLSCRFFSIWPSISIHALTKKIMWLYNFVVIIFSCRWTIWNACTKLCSHHPPASCGCYVKKVSGTRWGFWRERLGWADTLPEPWRIVEGRGFFQICPEFRTVVLVLCYPMQHSEGECTINILERWLFEHE